VILIGTDPIRVIKPEDRTPGDPTAGMIREEAVATGGMWAGLVRTEAGMASGWHHHGDYESVIHVLEGTLLMEFGPGGATTVPAGPGDFIHVPRGTVHRESNPDDTEGLAVVVRAGSGPPVVNVDGPPAD
jgi:uncharacterized RmlC-like cupin family protein